MSPANWEARQRRSPAIIWYFAPVTLRTVIGWMMPNSRILVASSCRASWSNSRRGWLGLGSICAISISLRFELPSVCTSLVSIRASSPRPVPISSSPRPSTLLAYFFFTAIILAVSYLLLLLAVFLYDFFGECQVVLRTCRVCVVEYYRQTMRRAL